MGIIHLTNLDMQTLQNGKNLKSKQIKVVNLCKIQITEAIPDWDNW